MPYTWGTFFTESTSVFTLLNYFIDAIPDVILYAVYIGVPVWIVKVIVERVKGVDHD